MTRIEGVCREVCDATEYVAIVTEGPDGPHLAGHWGSYMRIVEPGVAPSLRATVESGEEV